MTFRDDVDDQAPGAWAQGDLSGAFYGILVGLHGDQLAEGMRIATVGAWLAEPESPDDVLPIAARDVGFFRFPNETNAQFRARLLRWAEIYAAAGTKAGIDDQIAAAGHDGVVDFQIVAAGNYYWSQFWISTTEIEADALETMTNVANWLKQVQWVMRGFLFTGFTTYANAIAELAIGEDSIAA